MPNGIFLAKPEKEKEKSQNQEFYIMTKVWHLMGTWLNCKLVIANLVQSRSSRVSYMLADKCRPFLKHLIGVMTKPTSF